MWGYPVPKQRRKRLFARCTPTSLVQQHDVISFLFLPFITPGDAISIAECSQLLNASFKLFVDVVRFVYIRRFLVDQNPGMVRFRVKLSSCDRFALCQWLGIRTKCALWSNHNGIALSGLKYYHMFPYSTTSQSDRLIFESLSCIIDAIFCGCARECRLCYPIWIVAMKGFCHGRLLRNLSALVLLGDGYFATVSQIDSSEMSKSVVIEDEIDAPVRSSFFVRPFLLVRVASHVLEYPFNDIWQECVFSLTRVTKPPRPTTASLASLFQ